jgi:hypothetical protein
MKTAANWYSSSRDPGADMILMMVDGCLITMAYLIPVIILLRWVNPPGSGR